MLPAFYVCCIIILRCTSEEFFPWKQTRFIKGSQVQQKSLDHYKLVIWASNLDTEDSHEVSSKFSKYLLRNRVDKIYGMDGCVDALRTLREIHIWFLIIRGPFKFLVNPTITLSSSPKQKVPNCHKHSCSDFKTPYCKVGLYAQIDRRTNWQLYASPSGSIISKIIFSLLLNYL